MEEEKKKRPRVRTSEPLEERDENNQGNNRNSDERSERFNQDERSYRRPYSDSQDDRPRDFNQNERPARPYQDRQFRPGQYRDNYHRDHRSHGHDDYQERNFNRPDSYNRDTYNRDNNYNRGGSGYNRDRYQGGGGGYNRNDRNQGSGYNRDRNFHRGDRPYQPREERPYNDRPYQPRENRPYQPREGGGGYGGNRGDGFRNENRAGGFGGGNRGGGYGSKRGGSNRNGGFGGGNRGGRPNHARRLEYDMPDPNAPKPGLPTGEGMQLNKYLAHCGLASRRKAVEYIEAGQVTVNGKVITEPYYRVEAADVVKHNGNDLQIQERKVVLLFNKPKNVITTSDDEHGRTTVMQFIDPHYPERLYPVGRLDRDTTGLIVITNDGDLAQKLAHPSGKIYKQYRVSLDRPLSTRDMEKILAGFDLEDGAFQINWARYSQDGPPTNVELEIVIGRNRIVRRIFESLGYRVKALDRFYYGGLTKKNLPRGKFRELTDKEIIMLKHFSSHLPKDVEPSSETVED